MDPRRATQLIKEGRAGTDTDIRDTAVAVTGRRVELTIRIEHRTMPHRSTVGARCGWLAVRPAVAGGTAACPMHTGLDAEARGFEPRMGVNPNRISSAAP